jgi:nucleotide-binding universal stress UspA family protein
MACRPILVGASGSEQSLCAVNWAAREAALRSVPLRIVSVIPAGPGAHWPTAGGARPASLRHAATESLIDAAISASWSVPELTIDTALLTGDPGPVLADLGRRASMLVAGSRVASGPVSRYLSAHAPCPVVLHRDPAAPAQQVVVGVREPSGSEAPLAFAFDEASHRGAHLLVMQAWHWLPPSGNSTLTPAQLSAQALIRLHQLLEPWQEKYPGMEVGEEIIHGHPGRVLASLTATADLLVLGRHAHPVGGTDAALGSVSQAVLGHAHGPVAIVPAEVGHTS